MRMSTADSRRWTWVVGLVVWATALTSAAADPSVAELHARAGRIKTMQCKLSIRWQEALLTADRKLDRWFKGGGDYDVLYRAPGDLRVRLAGDAKGLPIRILTSAELWRYQAADGHAAQVNLKALRDHGAQATVTGVRQGMHWYYHPLFLFLHMDPAAARRLGTQTEKGEKLYLIEGTPTEDWRGDNEAAARKWQVIVDENGVVRQALVHRARFLQDVWQVVCSEVRLNVPVTDADYTFPLPADCPVADQTAAAATAFGEKVTLAATNPEGWTIESTRFLREAHLGPVGAADQLALALGIPGREVAVGPGGEVPLVVTPVEVATPQPQAANDSVVGVPCQYGGFRAVLLKAPWNGTNSNVLFSPAGDALYVVKASSVDRILVPSLQRTASLRIPTVYCTDSGFSKLGPVVLLSRLCEVWLLDPTSLQVVSRIPLSTTHQAIRLVTAPGTTTVVVVEAGEENVVVLDLAAGKVTSTLRGRDIRYSSAEFAAREQGIVHRFEHLAMTPDGSRLLFGGSFLYRCRLDSRGLFCEDRLAPVPEASQTSVVAPDGSYAVAHYRWKAPGPDGKPEANSRLECYDARDFKTCCFDLAPSTPRVPLARDPGSGSIYFTGVGCVLTARDAKGAVQFTLPEFFKEVCHGLAVHPAGQRLVVWTESRWLWVDLTDAGRAAAANLPPAIPKLGAPVVSVPRPVPVPGLPGPGTAPGQTPGGRPGATSGVAPGPAPAGPMWRDARFARAMDVIQRNKDFASALPLLEANINDVPDGPKADYDYGWACYCAAKLGKWPAAARYFAVMRTRYPGQIKSGNVSRNFDDKMAEVLALARAATAPEAKAALPEMERLWANPGPPSR